MKELQQYYIYDFYPSIDLAIENISDVFMLYKNHKIPYLIKIDLCANKWDRQDTIDSEHFGNFYISSEVIQLAEFCKNKYQKKEKFEIDKIFNTNLLSHAQSSKTLAKSYKNFFEELDFSKRYSDDDFPFHSWTRHLYNHFTIFVSNIDEVRLFKKTAHFKLSKNPYLKIDRPIAVKEELQERLFNIGAMFTLGNIID